MNEYKQDVLEEALLYYIRDKMHEIENKEYFDIRFKQIDVIKCNVAKELYKEVGTYEHTTNTTDDFNIDFND